MAENERGAMFDEFVQGGGRLDDVDITIVSARFKTWDYKGQVNPAVLALAIDAVSAEGEALETEFLSSGDLRFFVPSGDGKKAIPVGTQQKLNVNTNAIAFLISLMNADTRGELANKLRASDDISIIDGVKVHVVQKAQPKRPGIINPEAEPALPGGRAARPRTQLIVEKIISYPWEAAGAGANKTAATPVAQATAPAAAPTAAPAAGGDVVDQAVAALLGIVSEAGGSIKVGMIAGKFFSREDTKALAAPVKNVILGMIVKPEFLGAAGRPWAYDAATGTVAFG